MKRIGLIGAGWVTEHHLDAYEKIGDRARVVALADPSAKARTTRGERYAIERGYDSAEAMLDAETLDAVDIAAPREQHVVLVEQAAARGLPILCQKPLAPSYDRAARLVAGLGASTRLMVHENWRFRPHYRQIKSWLEAGRIGEITQVHLSLFTAGLIADENGRYPAIERQPFMADLDRMLLLEVMIHHVDTLRFLLGELDLEAARLVYGCPGIRGESGAMLALVTRASSTRAGVGVSLIGNFVTHGAPAGQLDGFRALGTEGAIVLEGSELRLAGAAPEQHTLDLPANYKASYRGAIAHFLDCLDSGEDFETAPQDNLETLRLVESAYAMDDARRF